MIWVTFNLSSANAFSLGKPDILSSGKGLSLMQVTKVKLAEYYHERGKLLYD